MSEGENAGPSGGESGGGDSSGVNATFIVKSKAREISHRSLIRKQQSDAEIVEENDHWLLSQISARTEVTGPGAEQRPVIAFGKIKFPQITKCPKYVVVPEEVSESFLEKLIIDHWGLPEPNLIISYLGDDKMFLDLKWNNLKRSFRKAIVEQTQYCGGWTLTEGICRGLTERVGKGMSLHGSHQSGIHKAYCVGVVPLSSIVKSERASLLRGRGEERRCMISQKCDRMIARHRRHYLDAHHTHYIIVDDTKNETDSDETFERAREVTKMVHKKVVDAAGKDSPVSWILQNQQRFRISDLRVSDNLRGKSRVAPLLYISFVGAQVDPRTIKEIRDALVSANVTDADQDSYTDSKLCRALVMVVVSNEEDGFGQLLKKCCSLKTEKAKKMSERRQELTPKVTELCAAMGLEESTIGDLVELSLFSTVSKLLNVINAEEIPNDEVFADKMVETFFRVHKRYETRLALSVFWNQLDMAQKHVFQRPDFKWVTEETEMAVYYAILMNKVEFLKEFAKRGFDVAEFLTIFRLTEFYNDIHAATLYTSGKMLLGYLEHGHQDKSERKKYYKADPGILCGVIGLRHVGELLTFLVGEGDTQHPYRSQSRYIASGAALYAISDDEKKDRQFVRSVSLTAASERKTPAQHLKPTETNRKIGEESGELDGHLTKKAHMKIWRLKHIMRNWDSGPFQSEERIQLVMQGKRECILEVAQFDNPAFHLFIYSILLNRREMAMFFFQEVLDALPASLMASKVLKKMALGCKDRKITSYIPESLHVNLKDEMNDYLFSATFFEQIAYDMLSVCYDTYQIPSSDVLLRPVPVLGNLTTFELALSADNRLFCARKFVAHPGFQSYLDLTWVGRLHESNLIALLLSCFFVPALFLLKYDEDGTNDVPGSIDLDSWIKKVDCTARTKKAEKTSYDEFGEETEEPRPPPSRKLTAIAKITYFFNAPIVQYVYHFAAHLVFLVLLSYDFVILYGSGLYWLDYLLMVWVLQLAFEEIRQCLSMKGKFLDKIVKYFGSSWRSVDIVGMVAFAVAMYINVGMAVYFPTLPSNDSMENFTGRVFYSVCLMMYYSKVLYFFTVTPTLGPTVVFIRRMLTDLFSFVCILLIFYAQWGLIQYGLLWPNSTAQWTLIRDILVMPFWQMFGGSYVNVIGQQPYEESSMLQSCSSNSTIYDTYGAVRCTDTRGRVLIPIMLAFYMFILNLLMINILIAIFNDTFATLKNKMLEHWSFQRCELLLEYYNKPPLAPPLIFICHLYWLFSTIARQYANRVVPQEIGDTEQLSVVITPPSDDTIMDERNNDDPDFKMD